MLATFDKITVEIDGKSYQLKEVGQLGMPNPQTIIINMASYPKVQKNKISPFCMQNVLSNICFKVWWILGALQYYCNTCRIYQL